MQLRCPRCKFAAYRPFASLRLETCPRCARAGRQVYLVDHDPAPGGRGAAARPARDVPGQSWRPAPDLQVEEG